LQAQSKHDCLFATLFKRISQTSGSGFSHFYFSKKN
jgi:hypothetical protein